jgi:cell division protein FtsN
MSQDFAKRHSTSNQPDRQISRFTLFVTGFIAGMFVSFLIYLWQTMPPDPATAEIPKPSEKPKVEEMSWDFYEIFPKSEVPIIEEYVDDVKVQNVQDHAYILQTGSFQNAVDADQLRAELLLMGLTVFVRKIDVDGNDWYRVIVGPLENDLALNRAQDTLAQAQIESLPLRVRR